MASDPTVRQRSNERAEKSARVVLSSSRRAAGAALAVAVVAASLALAQLAGWRTTPEDATPGFLATALGAPQADAPLVREPARGVRVAVARGEFRFERGGVTAGLAPSDGGGGPWARFARGTVRRTDFGSETIVVSGERGLEQFLTVEERRGRRTWRWRLTGSTLEPRPGADGSVELLAGTRSSGLRIDPVAILDVDGRDITPAGLRWDVARRGGAWWLELDLDDRSLPLPYVIDPAITASGANTAVGSSPLTIARPGAVGDLLIAQVLIRGTGTITAPAGWNLLQSTASGTSVRQAVYWKLATGSESTQWSWTGGTNGAGILLAYANPHPTAAPQSSTASGTASPAAATGVTTTHPGQMVVALYGQRSDAAFAQTAGEGLTAAATASTGGGSPANRVRVMAAAGAQSAAGPTGSKTATSSGAWVAQLVSFRRAPDDGDGTISAPTGVVAASTGNTVTLTYTAGDQGMADGAVAVDVPAGWSAPSTTGGDAGYTTASAGTVDVSGQRITVSGVTLGAGATLTIVYGSKASAGPGATASASTGAVVWPTLQRGTSGGTPAAIAAPSVWQYAPSGSGTAAAAPAAVAPGTTGNTVTVTYTAAGGGIAGGAVTVAVPAGWSAPSTTDGDPGYTTASTGSVSVSGQTITVSGVTLAAGAALTVTYGTGGGPGATSPGTGGAQTWLVQQRSVAAAPLASLASSPQVAVDHAPTATVSLAPASPTTDGTLTATATAADADGDPVTLTYVWKVNGITVGTTASSTALTDTLDLAQAGHGDKGDTVSVEVTPDDGDGGGAAATAAVTVANSAPQLLSVSVDQSGPRTDDGLTSSYTATDADGDLLTATRQWRRDGADLAGETGATLDLSQPGNGDRGDTLALRLSVSDGDASSATLTSSPVTVVNTAPTVASVTIDQAAPTTGETLTVTVVSNDADGDARTFTYQWAKGGVDRFGETAASYDLSLVGNGDKGDEVTVRVTASDGTDTSAPVTSGATTVANSPPTLSSVTIDDAAPRTNDTLTATVVASDPDGDAVTSARQWWRNGTDLAGETAASLDLSEPGNGDRGDSIALRVSVNDGTDAAGPLTSPAVVVANSAPTVAAVAIDQSSPRTEDELTVTVTSADEDGDVRTYAYEWLLNGSPLAGQTGAAHDLSQPGHGDRGDAVRVRVVASDGSASSAATASPEETVANTPPACTDTTLSTAQDTAGATAPLCTDADADALTPSIAGQGTRGVATVLAGQLRYAPNAGEEGTDTFRYRASDGTDQSGTASVGVTIQDVTPPQTTIESGPADGSTSTAAGATFAFSTDDPPATFACRLDGAAWTPCTSPHALSGLAEGAHAFEVRATDDGANTDPSPASRSWTVDSLAPETTLASTPADPTSDTTPEFTFGSEPGATFEARLDGGPWAPATSPHALGPIAPGTHTFDVRATDAAGNTDATAASFTWTVDTAPPDTALDAQPPDPDSNRTPTFAFSSSEGPATFACRVDAGSWDACTSPSTIAPLGDGSHTFAVRATDTAGNTDPTPASHTWVVDGGAPTVAIAAPAGFVNGGSADPVTIRATTPDDDVTQVEFLGCSEPGCSGGLETSLGVDSDGAPWELARAVPADGRWTIKAVATDAASNTGTAVVDVVVDRTAPAGGSIAVAPGYDTDGSVAIATSTGADGGGSGVDLGSAVVEREDAPLADGDCGSFDASWAQVTAPDATVATGRCYRYRLRVADEAGNWATFASADVVKVDLTPPPAPTLTVANVDGTEVAGTTVYFRPGTTGSFTVSPAASDPESGGVTYGHPTLGTGWSRVGTTWSFTAAAGEPTEPTAVSATNAAGLTGPAAPFTVIADSAAPTTTATASPAAAGSGWNTSTPVRVTLSAADGGAGVRAIRYTTDGSVPGPTSPVYAAPLDVLSLGTTTLAFRAEDAVGNLEAPATLTLRIDTTAPTTPTLAFSDLVNAAWDGGVVWFRPGAAGGFTVVPSASDAESGVAASAYPALGAGWSRTGGAYAFTAAAADPVEPNELTVTNGAGLPSAGAPLTVTADLNAPVSAATCDGAACSAGWYTAKPVTVVLTANDAQSGLDEIAWSADGSAPGSEYLAPLSLGDEGTTTVRFAARDGVGNVETVRAQEVRIDTVAPVAALGAVDPYLRGTVALASTQSDATSGVGTVRFQVSPAGAGAWTDVPAAWDTTSASDGEYDVRVRVTDVAGNATESAPVESRWVDNLAPTITLVAPPSPASGTVTLASTAADAHSGIDTVEYEYSPAGAGDWTAVPGTAWDTTPLADGSYDLRARATDRSGNASSWSVVGGVVVDDDPPSVAVTAPADASFVDAAAADPLTVSATAGDTGSGVASVEFLACTTTGSACSSWTSIALDATAPYTAAWTLPGDGERRLKAIATDAAGHTAEAVVTVVVDRTAPGASLTSPTAGADVRGTVALTAAAADATSGVSSVDFERSPAGASAWTPIGNDTDGVDGWDASLDTTLGGAAGASDGLYDLRVLVTDRAGNTGAHVASNVRIDNTAPTGTLTDAGEYLRGTVALSASAADAGSGVASVSFARSPEGADTWTTVGTDTDDADGWSTTFDTTTGGTPDGRYDLRVLVTDRAGNTHAHGLNGRTIDNTKPSAAIADPGANLRLTVALGAAADDATAGVATVAFEVDGGGGWQLVSTDTDGSNGWSASLDTTLPATPDGLYALRVTVTDRAGNRETSQLGGRRIDNTAPTVALVDPGPYLMGAVQLSASASDAGSGIDRVRFERSPAGSGGPWTQVGADAALGGGTWRATWITSPDGLYDLRAVVEDVAGNRTIDDVAGRRVDNTAPVTTDDAAAGRHNDDQTVTLSRTDTGSGPSATQYRVRPPGGSFGAWQSGTSVTVLAASGDGVHAIEYFSTDAAGNVESVKSTEVLIDTTGPSGTVTDPSTFLRGLVALAATADDPSDVSSVTFAYAPEGTAAWTTIGTDLTAGGSDGYTVEWDTTAVADIAYDLQVTFLDGLGNPTVRSLTGKTVDNELPAVALTAPAPGAVKRNVVAITANAADGVSGMREVRFEVKPAGAAGFSQVDVDGGSSPYSTSWSSSGSPDGPTDLRVIAVDNAGNLRSATTTIFVDNDAPTVTLTAPSTAVSGDVTLTATGSTDVQGVTFKAGGAAIGTDGDGADGFSVTWSTAGDGDQVVTAEATDVGGNIGTSAPVTVRVDNTPPTGALTAPGDGDTVGGGAIALAASASDPGSGVSAVVFEFRRTSDSTWTPVAGPVWDATAVATGAYHLRARITDNAGNSATTPAITVQVDSSAPTVVLTTPGSNGLSFSGVKTLAATVSGLDARRVVFALAPTGTGAWTRIGTDTSGADGWTHAFDTTVVPDGVYDVRGEVFDSYGNAAASVRTAIRIDNAAPRVVGSAPADGTALTASPGSIHVTASEPLSSVTGATLNGSPIATTVSGSSFSVALGALASGAYTLAGTLVDASATTAPFRVHFTVVTGSPTTPPYVERNVPPGATVALTAVDGASRVVVPAGAVGGGPDWLVVRIQPLVASSVSSSPAGAPAAVVDVTARWALAGTDVHSFLVPLEIVLTGGAGATVPATFEDGAWRLIRPIPVGGRLPEGSRDGFFRADDGVHVLTRHLSVFALIRDLQPPSPPRAVGVVAGDGLTLRWVPGTDNSGTVGQVKLYVDGEGYAHFDPTQTEAKLGPWTGGDTRRFTFTQFDLAGNESAQTEALRGVPSLVGRTLAEARAALAERGFSVGTVTERPSTAPPGTVVAPTDLALAEEGAAIDLVVAAGRTVTPPQAKLVLSVVSPKSFSWSTRKYVGLRVNVTRASDVTATLVGPRGGRLYTWRVTVKAGASVVKLRMPRQVRRPAVYRIVVTAASGGQTARRTVAVRLVGKRAALRAVPARAPLQVAVAADSRTRMLLARRLRGTRTRLVAAAGEAAFAITASRRRDVRVVVVDVDRFGLPLVRDLRAVFPTVRLLALVSRPADLRRAKKVGAQAALPRNAPAARIARAIRTLGARR